MRSSHVIIVFSDFAAANIASFDCTPPAMRAMVVP